jgi:hypothetical protein
MWQVISDFLADTARIAGSIATIGSLIGVVAWKPYKKYKEKQEVAAAIQKEKDKKAQEIIQSVADSAGAIKEVKHMICEVKTIVEENGRMVERHDRELLDLQRVSLKQTHDYLLQKGWASDEAKQDYAEQAEQYQVKGGNHLSDMYLKDVLGLPNEPTINEQGVIA